MVAFNEKYVTDKFGKTVAVLLDLDEFRRMVDDLEELDSIRAYDAAKSSGEQPIPFDQAVAEIERDRG
jgi:PHD/YefM family antitoxin component YafN of YafNO toxin-antitoxin module